MPAESHPTRIPRQNPAATADTLLDVRQKIYIQMNTTFENPDIIISNSAIVVKGTRIAIPSVKTISFEKRVDPESIIGSILSLGLLKPQPEWWDLKIKYGFLQSIKVDGAEYAPDAYTYVKSLHGRRLTPALRYISNKLSENENISLLRSDPEAYDGTINFVEYKVQSYIHLLNIYNTLVASIAA